MRFFLLLILAFTATSSYAAITFGNPHGKVTLVEYFDYNCPICRATAPAIFALASENPELKVVQKVVPALAPSSQFVDRMVLASFFQGKFSQMQSLVLGSHARETIPRSELISDARKAGLNLPQLFKDMQKPTITKQLSQNMKQWRTFHQHRIPIIVIFPTGHENLREVLVGEQSQDVLHNAVANAANLLK